MAADGNTLHFKLFSKIIIFLVDFILAICQITGIEITTTEK